MGSHTRLAAGLLLAAAFVGAAAPALAAEEAEGGHDLMELDWQQIVPAIAVFLILLWVLTKTAWKPILAGLQRREEAIRRALDEAAEANAKARALVEEYQVKMEAARADAQRIVEEGRRDAEALKTRIESDAQRIAEETRSRAVRDIEQARDKAFEQVLRDSAVIATEVASRIVRRHLDASGQADLVDEVVREFVAARTARGS